MLFRLLLFGVLLLGRSLCARYRMTMARMQELSRKPYYCMHAIEIEKLLAVLILVCRPR